MTWAIENAVAIYAAILSTMIVLVQVILWKFREIHLTVFGIHPNEHWAMKGHIGIVVSNSGRRPTSVRRIEFEGFDKKSARNRPNWTVVVDHRSMMDPAIMSVPVPGKPNTFTREPKVLGPGEEYSAQIGKQESYFPDQQWVRVSAFARGSRRRFKDWIAPQPIHGGN